VGQQRTSGVRRIIGQFVKKFNHRTFVGRIFLRRLWVLRYGIVCISVNTQRIDCACRGAN
jgi:hypothetical protein